MEARCVSLRALLENLLRGLSETIAVAARFGHLLDLPEHPHKGCAQADHDAQEQQRQAGGCEHVSIHEPISMNPIIDKLSIS
jgi:hypothetical protein